MIGPTILSNDDYLQAYSEVYRDTVKRRELEAIGSHAAALKMEVSNLQSQLAEAKILTLDDIKRMYDEEPDDGGFEGIDHPIVQMAQHIDALTKQLAEKDAEIERLRQTIDQFIHDESHGEPYPPKVCD